MLGKKEAMERLRPTLTEVIQDWINEKCDEDEWEALDTYVGENLASHMSDAAMSVLLGTIDLQEYLLREQECYNVSH